MTDHGNIDGSTTGAEDRAEEDLLGPELRSLLGSLPKAIPPERDLTQDIASLTWDRRADASWRKTVGTPRRRVWTLPRIQLAAAAVALIVITSATTTFLVRKQAERSVAANATIAPATTSPIEGYTFAGYEGVQRDYADAIADLTAAVEARRDRLAPETVQLIEENLRIIDRAIEQSLAALQDEPESLPLQQAVMTSFETKLDFLRRAAAITADG